MTNTFTTSAVIAAICLLALATYLSRPLAETPRLPSHIQMSMEDLPPLDETAEVCRTTCGDAGVFEVYSTCYVEDLYSVINAAPTCSQHCRCQGSSRY